MFHCQDDCFSLTCIQIDAKLKRAVLVFRGAEDQPRDGSDVDSCEIAPRSAQFRQDRRGNEDPIKGYPFGGASEDPHGTLRFRNGSESGAPPAMPGTTVGPFRRDGRLRKNQPLLLEQSQSKFLPETTNV
jgi:hypothetical protein